VLESGEFIKVGSSKVEKTNVGVVLLQLGYDQSSGKRKIQEDLYYRLNSVPIRYSRVRDRVDITSFVQEIAGDCAEKYMMPPITLTDDAKEKLKSYRWPVMCFN
jgi:DNA-binding NtrC family response regulator